jgi:glucosamine-6-phosphate deaminase
LAEVVICADVTHAGSLGADIVAALVAHQPTAVLGLATGSTPDPLYRSLADRVAAGLDLSRVRAFALDEYVGLSPTDPRCYRSVLTRDVVRPLGLDPHLVALPDNDPTRLQTAGERYEAAIDGAGGVDLQILGIGTDGHIGFNEPGSSLASRTRIKTLSPQTRRDNARFFDGDDDVPRLCITQGIGTILRARHLLLLAFGAHKAPAIAAAVEGPVTASVPASAIQLHPHVTVVVDDAAAAELERRDDYVAIQRAKPGWQDY